MKASASTSHCDSTGSPRSGQPQPIRSVLSNRLVACPIPAHGPPRAASPSRGIPDRTGRGPGWTEDRSGPGCWGKAVVAADGILPEYHAAGRGHVVDDDVGRLALRNAGAVVDAKAVPPCGSSQRYSMRAPRVPAEALGKHFWAALCTCRPTASRGAAACVDLAQPRHGCHPGLRQPWEAVATRGSATSRIA
jgi:hypothetical protein